jgi:hypothetical protein
MYTTANKNQLTALRRAIDKFEQLGVDEQTVYQLKQLLKILESHG